MSKIYMQNGDKKIEKIYSCFDPFLCGDCGQAFRWKEIEKDVLQGVIKDKKIVIKRTEKEEFEINVNEEYFNKYLIEYFDLNRDYDKIFASYDDENLSNKIRKHYGIRILKQDSWEALCSFIISQNNNIPRIKGIIERLCESFGEKIEEGIYTFPSPEVLAQKTVEDLSPLRAGFRAKYIIDAAQKVASGEVDFEKIRKMNLEDAENELVKIKGVGKKVAQCTLLFGFGMVNAFPVDVWIKRIMAEQYPDGLPECTKGTEGIAQQYLFTDRG